MRRRISIQAEQRPPVAEDGLVIRINWPRVAFAGLLAATVTILVTLIFQVTTERNPQVVSAGPAAAIEFSSAPKASFQATSEHNPQAVFGGPSAATQVSSVTETDLSPTLQLIKKPMAQATDDRLPLGILVRGPSEITSAAAIEIIGLPNGWALSAGWPFADRWRIPATRLSSAVILPPRGFTGAIDFAAELRLADDTLVERRFVHREKLDPVHGGEENTVLLRVADRLLAAGDIAAARVALRRATQAGNARAALLLGEIDARVSGVRGMQARRT
jgi:hypothetical protein